MLSRRCLAGAHSLQRSVLCQANARAFSKSALSSQGVNGSQQNDRTTHFGFETVSEAEKEGRGMKSP